MRVDRVGVAGLGTVSCWFGHLVESVEYVDQHGREVVAVRDAVWVAVGVALTAVALFAAWYSVLVPTRNTACALHGCDRTTWIVVQHHSRGRGIDAPFE
jgi:hypothetical protein